MRSTTHIFSSCFCARCQSLLRPTATSQCMQSRGIVWEPKRGQAPGKEASDLRIDRRPLGMLRSQASRSQLSGNIHNMLRPKCVRDARPGMLGEGLRDVLKSARPPCSSSAECLIAGKAGHSIGRQYGRETDELAVVLPRGNMLSPWSSILSCCCDVHLPVHR